MRIDRSRIKKSTSEVPAECQALIEKLRSCSKAELLEELKKIDTWTFGKCELYHWIDILDLCDSILEAAAAHVRPGSWQIACDLPENSESKELLLWVLHFTTLLIEHSFSRHLYNSVEHLLTLLSSCDLNVVLAVLNLLYMFSKRSNFITRINPDMRNALLKCLTYLAESWGGQENGFGLAECVREDATFPGTATTLHYEFYTEDKSATSQASCIHLENVDQLSSLPSEIMDRLIENFHVPKEGHMVMFTHLRLAHSFSKHALRLKCVQARLQALSVLLYSNADSHSLLYPGLLDELVQLLELRDPDTSLVEIRSAALRTLTSIIHLDRSPHLPKKPGSRLNLIIEVTGASLYHGFLPQLVRSCISSLTNDTSQKGGEEETEEQFPLPLVTALFSFLYHLASYETGGEALVSCGMMESLLRVINWPGVELEHITFVTRAVRVIDLITNIDMQSFQSHGGLNSFINRLEMEMNICRQDQPYEIVVANQRRYQRNDDSHEETAELDEEMVRIAIDSDSNPSCSNYQMADASVEKTQTPDNAGKSNKSCLPQRAALLKSMLNFLKKALQDPAFSDSIRHVMDGSLPNSLKHIISNAEYYGPSLFLLATDVVAVYVFQEPSLLSSLQDVGLTDVVLHALLIKNVPATREVLGSVPNVFSALCLNARGLSSFVAYKPFEKLLKVLVSPGYLAAMRRRRSSDPIGDTASNLGNAMDELMRHQPTLKADAIAAIIKLLQELCQLGRDPKYVCWKPQKGTSGGSEAGTAHTAARVSNEAGSSDEEEEDEEEASTSSHPTPPRDDANPAAAPPLASEKTPIALVDYILNVMKFVDAILSNNSTDDHCREFVNQSGLVPLLSILGLPNLPVDYPITPAAQAVASVCKSVLNLAHEPQVMQQGLTQLSEVLGRLAPLSLRQHSGSMLLEELAAAPCMENAFSTPGATPLLHAMAAAHGYVIMFVHVCRTGQLDIRTISMTHWGSELGLSVLSQLADLYTALVWESTVLLALCSDDTSREFAKEDVSKIYPSNMMRMSESMEVSGDTQDENMEVDDDNYYKNRSTGTGTGTSSRPSSVIPQNIKLKFIKPLLGASSRLGRALAELFGLLVKLCVGFPVRTRRGNHLTNTPVSPTPSAHAVANSLAALLARGLNHQHLPASPVPKFKLTYLICSVGFTQPMLFDEKRYPYHLMLQKFMRSKGQAAFFETFKWALSGGGKFPVEEGLTHKELPEGTGEFLDAWLLLLEKMVNPKAILETTHMLPARISPMGKHFDPLVYLQQVHKMAFEALSYLWGRPPLPTYGARMTETMLTIYRHIVRGEKIVEERRQKENETTVVVNPAAGSGTGESRRGPHRPEVNPTELTQLMDMGFSREHCYEALILTATLEHATDYLLNNFFPHNVQPNQPTDTEDAVEMEDSLSKESLDEFSTQVLEECLNYIEKLPDSVYRVSDLLTIIIRRNGETYCYQLLDALVQQTKENVNLLIEEVANRVAAGNSKTDIHEASLTSSFAIRISGNLHLFMLLFEEMRVPCAKVVHSSGLLSAVIRLLTQTTEYMEDGAATPKWMTPILLLIDLLEKVSVCINRQINMHKVTTQVWRWLDLTSGKWSTYLPNNNKLINEAYWRGDRDVTITSGRRRYRIVFYMMVQMNDDSGKARPVMMTLIDPKDPTAKSNFDNQPKPTDLPPFPTQMTNPEEKDPNDPLESLSEPEYYVDFYHRRSGLKPIDGISPQDIQLILRYCMSLISKPVDADTLHAVMQLCVRFTRDYENARIIAESGAVKRLLKLTQASGFTGFVGLATMLIRHILEEPANIVAAIERVIRFKTLPNIPPTFKEVNYILRECAPAICRDPEIFKSVAKEIMRVDISVLNKRSEEEDPRLLMKCLPADSQKNSAAAKDVDRLVKRTVTQLLNALVEAHQEELAVAATASSDSDEPATLTESSDSCPPSIFDPPEMNTTSTSRTDQEPDLDNFNASNLPMYIAATGPASSSYAPNAPKKTSVTQQTTQQEKKKRLPLLTISNLLKILGDAVRSYGCIAKMITDHKYSAKQYDTFKEDCSAVAFVLDHLMPVRDNKDGNGNNSSPQLDSERPSMARNLLAALASCNHSPDAQCALVTEVKAALARTLAWPESTKKHTHIQDLVGVVTTMIENCPPVPISSTPLSPALKLNQYSVNNMVRFMMRKGIVTDLARIPHSLDLSSPKMAATVNAALKPLETLSRIMSQPTGGANSTSPTKAKPKLTESGNTTQINDDIGTIPPANIQAGGDSLNNQVTRMDQSGNETAAADDDNADMIDDHPEILNEVMNRVVETVNEMEDLMHNVIDRRRIPNIRMDRRRRARGQSRVLSDLSRFSSIFSSSSDLNNFSNNEETSQDSSSDDSDSNPTDEERHMDDGTTDMDDQVEEDEEEDEDEDEDDDDDDDDDEEQDGEDNEGEESNGGYDEDGLELFEPDDGLFRIPGLDRDSDDFLMIEYSEPDTTASLGQSWARDSFLPFSLFDDTPNTNNDSSNGSSRIPSHHPMLTARQGSDQPAAASGSRSQRMSRARRYQYVQMNRAAVAAPVFLQRLMSQGSSEPPSYLNIPGHPGNTYGDVLASTFPNTRLIVMDNGLGILTNSEEEQINFVDQSGYLLGPSLAATLNNVPTSVYWWNEELRLLDRDSICDCSICVGFELVPIFEHYRNEEFAERKEKRKKMDEEEDNNKKASSSNGETEKKKLYDGIMDMFEPTPRPPTRLPTRRIAMLAAAQEVAQATESLAGSIVESVLHPRTVQPPTALPLLPIQPPPSAGPSPSSPQEPTDSGETNNETDNEANQLVVHFVPPAGATIVRSIPEALELIPVTSGEISDPMGLIPGSVPYQPPTDPEDGFYRVNPALLRPTDQPQSTLPQNTGGQQVTEGVTGTQPLPAETNNGGSDYRLLRSIPVPVDMSSSSSGSQFLLQGPTSEALEIEMAANWIQTQMGHSTPVDAEEQPLAPTSAPATALPDLPTPTAEPTPQSPDPSQQLNIETAENQPPLPPPMPLESATETAVPGPQSSFLSDDIPEGVDPSFLAALPEDMRAEVISEHLRLQRMQSRVQQSSGSTGTANTVDGEDSQAFNPTHTTTEVNADFLAALPPAIQEEVLAQQRMEQQRQAAALSNPNDPVDAAAFFQDLPHSLRQAILTDMEESQISVLPPELAAEAQNLRREWEARNRQLMQERFLSHVTHSTTTLSSILRHTSTPRNISSDDSDHTYRSLWHTLMRAESYAEVPSDNGTNNVGPAERDQEQATERDQEQATEREEPFPTSWVLSCGGRLSVGSDPFSIEVRLQVPSMFPGGSPVPVVFLCYTEEQFVTACRIMRRCLTQEDQNDDDGETSEDSEVEGEEVDVTGISEEDSSSSEEEDAMIFVGRPTGPRYSIQNMGSGTGRAHWLSSWNLGARLLDSAAPGSQSTTLTGSNLANAGVMGRPRGRQVLDYESICCLLVLLFVDDSRLNTARLHRVFRNLCYHPPTREWVIRAILSIMEKSNEGQPQVQPSLGGNSVRRVTRSQSQPSPEPTAAVSVSALTSSSVSSAAARSGSSWLNISMDAALGCRATVFHVTKNPGRRNDHARTITINPQAAPFVYRHALEILISLARIFPSYFVPGKPSAVGGNGSSVSGSVTASPPKSAKSPRPGDNSSNFWDLLIRLDSLSTSKKGKIAARPSAPPTADPENLCLESSPFGQLLKMLASPVVHRSPLLMDKLLRLLSLISISLQVHRQRLWDKVEVNNVTLEHLGLAIDVLTSNTCSEEGLEDATALLLNMTVNLANTRDKVLSLLLEAARNTASLVCSHIDLLLRELRQYNSQQGTPEDSDDAGTTAGTSGAAAAVDSRVTSLKGILSNRFTKDTVVVVTAPKKVKAGLDLQLNSMAPLISKSSSQAFFLRILKVIVQLRESVRNFDKKKRKQAAENGTGSTVESRAENGTGSTLESRSTNGTTSSSEPSQSSQEDNAAVAPDADVDAESEDVPMDTSPAPAPTTAPTINTPPKPAGSSSGSETAEDTPLPPLSEQLDLDVLWETLSECLTELQTTQDNHAVLVLQPAVEAFFLVHASGVEKPEPTGTGTTVAATAPSSSNGAATDRVANSQSQSLGLDALANAPPPVSPLPSDPTLPTEPSTSAAAYFSAAAAQAAGTQDNQPPASPNQIKFLKFAEKHRTVLNQILRQSTTHLLEPPFNVLVNHTRVLDFDVKRRYFRGELERADEGHRREELAVHVRRTQVFEDSFRELHRRSPDEWKNRFYIVFEGEEGQDAGGLLREWYMIISREIFNPMYALFTTSPGDRVTYMINQSSHCNPNHLCYFKFVGRVIAKAIYDNKLLECYFTRSFYKHILGILVKYTDMESEDYSFYQGLVYLMENTVDSLGYELTFSTEVQEFGVTEVRDLIPNGRNLAVSEENKMEYIRLVCQMKMTGAIRKQLNAFLEGFYDIIPKRLISIFNEQELELLISGLPNVDIEDLRLNTEYYKYQHNSLQIQWFWRALREFDQAERAKFLQFVTGTSKVPLQGFAALEGMNGVQKFQIHRDERSTDRLPSAHTCFNQLDLPVYETYTKLRGYLLKAIHECSEGFGFA